MARGSRWTEEQLNDYLKQRAAAGSRATRKDADVERNAANGSTVDGKKTKVRRDTPKPPKKADVRACIQKPVVIRFTHHRHRLPDLDGVSVKYVLDALVAFRLLHDDSAKFIPDPPEHKFIKIGTKEEEKTVVEIWEA